MPKNDKNYLKDAYASFYLILIILSFKFKKTMKLLEGKTAIITGASRGIGKGIALTFAKQGANIAFTYLSSEDKAKALEEELSAFGMKVKGLNLMHRNLMLLIELSR